MLSRLLIRPVSVSRLVRVGLASPNGIDRATTLLSVSDCRENDLQYRHTSFSAGHYGYVTKAQRESIALPVSQGILKQYGLYPLVGLGLAAAVSKELLIIDPEFAYLCCMSTIMFGAYVLKGDDVKKMAEEHRDAELKTWSTMYEAQIAKYQTDIMRLEAFSKRPAMYAEYKAEYAEALAGVIIAQRMIAQQEMKNKVEMKLKELVDLETAASEKLHKVYKNRIIDYVRKYLGSPDGQNEALSEAMAAVGKPAGQVKADMGIIKKVVDRYIASGQADKDLQASAKSLGIA